MNQKNIAIAAILAAALLAGIFSTTTPMAVYAEDDYDDDEHDDDERDYEGDRDDNGRDHDDDDYKGDGDESETNTEQAMKQKNVGSGESTNFNCGENSIDGGLIDVQACGTVGADGGDGDGGVEVTICHVSASGNEIEQDLPPSAAAAHLAQHDGPPGSGPDYLGECDGRTPPR